MSSKQTKSLAYVLRLFPRRSGDGWVWRASLVNPYTEEREAFGSLEQLVAYLNARCRSAGAQPLAGKGGWALPRPGADEQPLPDAGDGRPQEPEGERQVPEKEVRPAENDLELSDS